MSAADAVAAKASAIVVVVLSEPEVAIAVVVYTVAMTLTFVHLAHILVAIGVLHRNKAIVELATGIHKFLGIGMEDVFKATRSQAVGCVEVAVAHDS